ncbi:MAG: signal peptide peptidase SppA [Candidatus Hydrogenedentota bacterium]
MKIRTVFGILLSLALLFIIFIQLLVILGIFISRQDRGVPFITSVGVIEITGTIMSSDQTLGHLKKAEENNFIKGVILKINSRGGAIGPCQEIYDKLINYKKPVVIYIQGLGASGGYYIASSCENIVAERGAITGSIGVLFHSLYFEETMKKLGIGETVVKSGKFKDAGSITRHLTEEEYKYFQGVIDELYLQFVKDIAFGRKQRWLKLYPELKDLKDEEYINRFRKIFKDEIDGRVFTGGEAFNKGFIDKLGTFDTAIDLMKDILDIKEDPNLIFYRNYDHDKFKFFGLSLFNNKITNPLPPGFYYLMRW